MYRFLLLFFFSFSRYIFFFFFFFNDTATTEIYTLSLHDALPIFNTQAFIALLDEILEPSVRLLRSAESRVLTHGPEATAVHRRSNAAGVGWLAGETESLEIVRVRPPGGIGHEWKRESAQGAIGDLAFRIRWLAPWLLSTAGPSAARRH